MDPGLARTLTKINETNGAVFAATQDQRGRTYHLKTDHLETDRPCADGSLIAKSAPPDDKFAAEICP